MKFIFATGIFPPDIGGPATYVEKLAEELNRRNFRVAVIAYSDKNLKSNYNFSVIRISRKYPKILRHFIYFLKLLKLAENCDVLYAQNVTSAGLPALLASKLLKKKFILKIVGDAAWEQKKEYLRYIQRYVAKSARQIIVPSQFVKKMVIDWRVPENKIKVIYNAVEESNLDIPKEKAKKEIGIDGDVILSIGRLVPWKGFESLIGIMPDLLKENSNFKLLIVGEGEEKESLKFKVKSLKLENNVKLVGKVSHSQVRLYLKAADIFVLNSEYEGLSHAILEAMQLGVPVVASRQGGNPELIEDNFNGFLIEYNNQNQLKEAILRIWRDKNFQDKFVQNSKEKLKNFTWENLVKKTLEILSSNS